MHCLDRRLDEVRSFMGLLGKADAPVARRALESARKLPRASLCGDRAELEAVTARPSPQRRELERDLAQANAQRALANYKDSESTLTSTLTRARAAHDAPIEAETLLALGKLRLEVGDGPGAEKILFDGYRAALAAGTPWMAAHAAVLLQRAEGRWLGRFDVADRWDALAEATLRQLGGHPRLEGELCLARGYVLGAKGQFEEGLLQRARGLELLERALGPNDPEVGTALRQLCHAQYAARAQDLGAAACERAITLLERAYGPKHPEVAKARYSLGNTLSVKGQYREAAAQYERAIVIVEATLGEAPERALYENALGEALDRLGRTADAETHLRRAVVSHEALLGTTHPDVAADRVVLARNLLNQGRIDDAREEGRRALEILSAKGHEDSVYALDALAVLGRAAMARGQWIQAEAELERALTLAQRTQGAEHYYTSTAHCNLGELWLLRGLVQRAEQSLSRCLRIRESTPGVEPADLAETRFSLARARLRLKDGAGAAELLAAAKKGFESLGPAGAQRLGELAALSAQGSSGWQ
jgi:tetratricopeptide (TPR) repeat protein